MSITRLDMEFDFSQYKGNVWDRQKGESAAAYKAFQMWCNLPKSRRNKNGYERFKGDLYDGKRYEKNGRRIQMSSSEVGWMTKWQWIERSEAKDAYEAVRYAQENAEKQREANEANAKIAMAMRAIVAKALIQVDPVALAKNPTALVKMAEVYHRMERLSLEQATDNVMIGETNKGLFDIIAKADEIAQKNAKKD